MRILLQDRGVPEDLHHLLGLKEEGVVVFHEQLIKLSNSK